MRRYFFVSVASSVCAFGAFSAVGGCDGDDASPRAAAVDSGFDAASTPPTTTGTNEGGPSTPPDDGGGDAAPTCPPAWTARPVLPDALAVPDGGAPVIFHAAATGTQNYVCQSSTIDGGLSYSWVLAGPEADLFDCEATKVGTHFASDGGAAAPEWKALDGTFVIAKKLAASTPDGGAASVPWLLLQATSTGGSGALGKTTYIQRANTDGGIAPASACGAGNVGALEKVNYTADYYFSGAP